MNIEMNDEVKGWVLIVGWIAIVVVAVVLIVALSSL